jgi:hypothetical protein
MMGASQPLEADTKENYCCRWVTRRRFQKLQQPRVLDFVLSAVEYAKQKALHHILYLGPWFHLDA